MKFEINHFSDNLAQIYGEVNGFAVRSFDQNRYYWSVSVFGFINDHSQLKTSTNVNNRTLGTLDDVRNWIDKAFSLELV